MEQAEESLELIFATEESQDILPMEKWKVIIADDEEDVHSVTQMVLNDFEFNGKGLELINAYSANETIKLLQENPDTAVLLLDVVMETEHAGLDAVKKIRNELGNRFVRIILRTGQPGQAPEKQVVVDYDINDYKSKTELTSQKLYTSMISALRSYVDLQTIEKNRRGLFKILESAGAFDLNSLSRYVSGLLTQFCALLEIDESDIMIVRSIMGKGSNEGYFEIVGAAGINEKLMGREIAEALPENSVNSILKAFHDTSSNYDSEGAAYYFGTINHGDVVVAFSKPKEMDDVDVALADIFCQKILLAISNFEHLNRMDRDRFSSVFGSALLAEPAGLTVRPELEKMYLLCASLSRRLQLTNAFPLEIDNEFVENIGIASVLHDIGNYKMPIELLLKKGSLSDEEKKTLAQHTLQGEEILQRMSSGNKLDYIEMAEKIALGHHEFFNGEGYPNGLKGENIPLAARIVAVVDTYVAMTTERPYRVAFQPEEALSQIAQGAGARFDPEIVTAFEETAANFTRYGDGLLTGLTSSSLTRKLLLLLNRDN